MTYPAGSGTFDRSRILDRVNRRGSPLVVLLAPAGYEKTEVALAVARTHRSFARIECASDSPFCTDLAAALGAQSAANDDLATAWHALENYALLIDNIECLQERPQELAALRALLDPLPLPGNRRLLVCGRHDPGIGFSSHVEPDKITILRSEHLAFTESEMRALFEPVRIDDGQLYRLQAITGGWPVPVLYCLRVAQSGDIEELFASTVEASFSGLVEYIDLSVIAKLPDNVLWGLCAVVGIAGIRPQEIDELFDEKNAPPLSITMTSTYEIASPSSSLGMDVNGLVRCVMRARHEHEICEVQRAFGAFFKERREFGRAAQAYLSAGDIKTAATFLQSGREVDGLASFDAFSPPPEIDEPADLVSYPALWAAVLGARRLSVHSAVLANEARTVLQNLDAQTDPMVRNTVTAMSAMAMLEDGKLDEGAALLAAFQIPDNKEQYILPILAARATIDSYVGAFERALATWYHIRPLARTNAATFAQLTRIEIRAARARGEWEVELEALARMLSAAEESRIVTVVGTALAEAVFGSWLAQESELLDSYRDRLGSLLAEHDIPALVNLNLAARGLPFASNALSKHWDALACLMACADASNNETAATLARSACELADESGSAFTRILARVALSEKHVPARVPLLQEALEISATMDSPPLQRSLKCLIDNLEPFGMLTPLVHRLRAGTAAARTSGEVVRVRIGMADAIVRRNDVPVNVSQGGWGLLGILSLEGRPVHRDVLCDRLWPNMPLESGYNALKMCVRRTRVQLGSADAILSTQGGYALADWVEVDLVEMERLLATITTGAVNDDDLRRVAIYFDAMTPGRQARFSEWEWSSTLEQRLESFGRAFGNLLCERALAAGDFTRAIELAENLVALDPLDETARKLLISSLLASGDRASAIRQFRSYTTILKDELDIEASSELKELLAL
ncbi:MAG TPA: BTAD domain-containing putative transcriptional regulator [Candidatus Baltobacteraceae bacterium]|nr:BTAD domain-containing putative transcriptional regulator [Candidatus Baltobacteraceae bacterium]